jgi:hypothetical protein
MPWMNNHFYFVLERHEPQCILSLLNLCVEYVRAACHDFRLHTMIICLPHCKCIVYILVSILYTSESKEGTSECDHYHSNYIKK